MSDMNQRQQDVVDSYYRCQHSDGFLDTFYARFMDKSPEIAKLFERTDFRLQKLMLRQSLLEMICFDRGIGGIDRELKRLSQRHDELGITRPMYQMWLDSLCEAVRLHDPRCDDRLEAQWRKTMRNAIELIASYDDTDPSAGDSVPGEASTSDEH